MGLAEDALRRFDGATALALYDKMHAAGNTSDQVIAGRIRALWLLRRWPEARALLPTLTDSIHAELVRGLIALGQPDDPKFLTFHCGSYQRDEEAALKAFRAALDMDDTCAEALAGYATALRTSGRAAEGIRMLTDSGRRATPVLVELAMSAYEREDYTATIEYIAWIEDSGPDHLRKHLLRLSMARNVAPVTSEIVQQIEDLAREVDPPPAELPELHGWLLLAHADIALDPAATRNEAMAKFHESTEIGPVLPGAIVGMATILKLDDRAAAIEKVKEVIEHESTSPQLWRYLADLKSEVSGSPSDRLLDYQKVLELDRRELNARLQMASAHRDLREEIEAHRILEDLHNEFPYNVTVERAWLEIPWQIAASVATRVDKPWEGNQDSPKAVLEVLSTEVVGKFLMPPEAETRLRDGVKADANTILQRAHKEEQEYLLAKEDHQRKTVRARRGFPLWLFGYAVMGVVGLAVAFSVGFLMWQLGELVGLPVGWLWAAAVGVPVVLATTGVIMEVVSAGGDGTTVMVVSCLAALGADFWQAIRLLGVGFGITVAIGVALVTLAVFVGGLILTDEFGKPSRVNMQRTFDQWLEMLYGKGVLPIATEVSSRPGSAYNTTLPVRSRIVSDEDVDIDTEASRELSQLLTQRTKGSFALAGPRGAGKSSLLSRWCAGQFLRELGKEGEQRRDLTVRVDAPVGYQSKDFLVHLFGRLCDAVEKYANDHEAAIAKLSNQPASRPSRLFRAFPAELDRAGRGSLDTSFDLRRAAAQERHKLRYQQSRTNEGELSLGVPPVKGTTFGVKGKVSVRRDEVPFTHPELVDRFRDFLRGAAEVVGRLEGKVLIGIDELDRISDGTAAQMFLNELKAVFVVPNCYFLVSVSEDALADFDLSAMGMRTVFDSAFDTIVRVDYLDFQEAKQLLNRRVLDLPEQFAALAYVLAGGLARELVRTVERIGNPNEPEKRQLTAVATDLARRQLHRTTRAAMDRLNRSADRRDSARLIRLLDEHPTDTLTAPGLRGYATDLAADAPAADEPELIDNVRQHAAVMAEYLAVLLAVFDDRLDKQRMERGTVSGPGNFETLARVRRYLGANPYGARELLHGFSEAWDLDGAPAGHQPSDPGNHAPDGIPAAT